MLVDIGLGLTQHDPHKGVTEVKVTNLEFLYKSKKFCV